MLYTNDILQIVTRMHVFSFQKKHCEIESHSSEVYSMHSLFNAQFYTEGLKAYVQGIYTNNVHKSDRQRYSKNVQIKWKQIDLHSFTTMQQ